MMDNDYIQNVGVLNDAHIRPHTTQQEVNYWTYCEPWIIAQ
jgi:hypothetical protein